MTGDWGPGAPDSPLSEPERRQSEPSAQQGGTSDEAKEPAQQPEEEPEGQQSELHRYESRFHGSVQDAMRFGEYAFLPVFGFNEANIAARKYSEEHGFQDDDTVINIREDDPIMIGGKDLTWWEESSIMPKHPFMLVNPLGFASVDPDVHNFRDVFRVSKGEHFVYSDSGGYQLMSMTGEDGGKEAKIVQNPKDHKFNEYRVYPEKLVEWQVHNADAGATIDYPPYNISGDSSFPDAVEHNQEWQDFREMREGKSFDMTARMARKLRSLRDSDDDQAEDYIFAPVIHGKPHPNEPHKYIRQWHQAMLTASKKHDIEPRGWTLKPEPASNFGQVALFLAYAEEYLQDAPYIHVLMVGGLLQKTLLMYYAKGSPHFVTSDASSYAAGGMRRQFDLPKTATRRAVIISNRSDEDDNAPMDPNHLDRYPCRCTVCSTVEQEHGFEFVTEGSGSARSVSLNLHNLQQILNVERTIDALLREDEIQLVETGGEPTGSEFWRYVKTVAGEKKVMDLYRAMDYLRLTREEGLDYANSKYRVKWNQSGGKSIDRGSGSGADTDW